MLVNSYTADDPKSESVNIDTSPLKKKKRKPKKPKATETGDINSEPIPTVNKENDEKAGNLSEEKKKKKRNNKKKPVEPNGEKSDNLISTTFQALKVQSVENKKRSVLNVVADKNKGKITSKSSANIKRHTVGKTDSQSNNTTKAVPSEGDQQKQPKSQIKSNNKSPLRLQYTVAKEGVFPEEKDINQQKKKNSINNKTKKSTVDEGKAIKNKAQIQKVESIEDPKNITQISYASVNAQQKKIDNNKKPSNQKPKSNSNNKHPPGLLNEVNGGEELEAQQQDQQKKKKKKNKKKNSGTQEISSEHNETENQKISGSKPLAIGIADNEALIAALKKHILDKKSSVECASLDECDSQFTKREKSQSNKKTPPTPKTTPTQVEQNFEEPNTGQYKEKSADFLPVNLTDSVPKNTFSPVPPMDATQKDKSREDVLAAREAKRLAKLQAKKTKGDGKVNANKENLAVSTSSDKNEKVVNDSALATTNHSSNSESKETINQQVEGVKSEKIEVVSSNDAKVDKSREAILAEREAKKLAKKAGKLKGKSGNEPSAPDSVEKTDPVVATKQKVEDKAPSREHAIAPVPQEEKKKPTTKAERRAIQEAQRAAKSKLLVEKQHPAAKAKIDTPQKKEAASLEPRKLEKTPTVTSPNKPRTFKVKLFNHLQAKIGEQNFFVNNQQIHHAMVKLGEQYAKRTVVGSNARCLAFLDALKTVIQDYETPPKKEFARGLETTVKNCVDHLQKCRPLAVSVYNAYRYIKMVLTKLPPNQLESDLKKELVELIDNYIKDQIEKAAQGISYYVQGKITNGDVILTYGCSSLINYILEEAHRRQVNFRVVVVDSRPYCEGQELLRRLVLKGISCTCVLINAVGFIMPEVTKVLLGAHALLANGFVMSRTGTAQVALVAKSFNVPVLVCCETHKFSERVQTDAIVYNELGDPNNLISKTKDCRLTNWKSYPSLYPLNLNYDVTPPELVTAVVTEIRFLPCTSAPVILRIRPSEMVS